MEWWSGGVVEGESRAKHIHSSTPPLPLPMARDGADILDTLLSEREDGR